MAGLYIHIPFCVKKCAYCDFVSFEDHSLMRRYLSALERESALYADMPYRRTVDTVFIGGGTPSILPYGAVARLLHVLCSRFSIAPDAEVTIECNPGTVDERKLAEYRAAGVNRLSFGVQSADDALLSRIGRIHTYSDFLKSYELARQAGFDNINADVMYGLPEQTRAQHLDTLRRLDELGLEHVSAYSLILEEGTPLYASGCALPDEDETYAMHRDTIGFLTGRGYVRYEISNYAKPGRMCRHNLNYWENGEYLGLGLNAHSAMRLEKRGWTRWSNTCNLEKYIIEVTNGRQPVESKARIRRDEEMFESVMLGLRKIEGISLGRFKARFGQNFLHVYTKAVSELKSKGWLEISDGRVYLTDEGLDVQNQALLYFLPVN